MRPKETDYREQCQRLLKWEDLRRLLPDLGEEKCVSLLRRGTRRCHVMARRYVMERALEDYISVNKNLVADSGELRDLTASFAMIDMNYYSYDVVNAEFMIHSLLKGFTQTWRIEKLGHSWHGVEITLPEEIAEPFSSVDVFFYDAMKRQWIFTFEITPLEMTYRQYKRWIPVLQKWQDRVIAAIAARTL